MGKKALESKFPHSAIEESESDHLGLERLVFFSDAVFAIAITLLALEIRLPTIEGAISDEELLHNLQSIGSSYLGYILSFLVIGVFWIGHHRRFRFIERYDNRLLFLNLILLMVVAFVPFPTSVISEFGNKTATIFYAATMGSIGLISVGIWGYASTGHRLVKSSLDAKAIRQELLRGLVIPAVFLLSMGLALVNADLAKWSWLLLLPIWLFIH